MNYFFELKNDLLSEADKSYYKFEAKKHIEKLSFEAIKANSLYSSITNYRVEFDLENEVIKLHLDCDLSINNLINKLLKYESSLSYDGFRFFEIDCTTDFFKDRLLYFLAYCLEDQSYFPRNNKLDINEIKAAKNLIGLIHKFKEICRECIFDYDAKLILRINNIELN